MGKPENAVYERFLKRYQRINSKVGKEQFVVPYLMSSHPGSTLKEAVELAEYLRDLGYMRSRCRIFIRRHPQSRRVCIIPDMIHAQWNRYMCLKIRMKRQCSVR